MFPDRWQLHQLPFRPPASFYASPTHTEALARVDYLVDGHHQLGLLTGRAGTGKSVVLEQLLQQRRQEGYACALVNLTGLSPLRLAGELGAQLGSPLERPLDELTAWQSLTDKLAENRYQRIPVLLAFDDIHSAMESTLSLLLQLIHFNSSTEDPATFVVASRPQATTLPSFCDLAGLRVELEPWEQPETAAYLQHELSRCGCHVPLFHDTAVEAIQQQSAGIPRQVVRLAELSIVAAAALQAEQIVGDIVGGVAEELVR